MEEQVTQHVGLVGYLHNLVSEHPNFEVLIEPTLDHLYSFRYLPNGLHTSQRNIEQLLDRLNKEIVASVQREGFTLVNKTRVRGRVAISISICCSDNTVREDVDAAFEAIARCGRLLTKNQLTSRVLTRDMESSYV